jgi:hypothetical protein
MRGAPDGPWLCRARFSDLFSSVSELGGVACRQAGFVGRRPPTNGRFSVALVIRKLEGLPLAITHPQIPSKEGTLTDAHSMVVGTGAIHF